MLTDNLGYAKLYHPRGPCVTLPVPPDPREAFAHISLCLDAGWLVVAPGMEAGEVKEEVGYVLKGSSDTAPYLLLYSTNEMLVFSFLKVYLDKPHDIEAFERAAGVKLSDLPEYMGSDKPERGKNRNLDRYIVPMKIPFTVVYKPNPRYVEADAKACKERNEPYKKPARVFVRWGDQAHGEPPAKEPAAQQPKTNGTPPSSRPAAKPTVEPIEDKHTKVLAGFRTARTVSYVKEMAAWAANQNFPEHMMDEQSDAYHEAMERLARNTNGKPAMAGR